MLSVGELIEMLEDADRDYKVVVIDDYDNEVSVDDVHIDYDNKIVNIY